MNAWIFLDGGTMAKKTLHVTGAVLERDGKIFAAQRGASMSLGGLWEFPGGKIEPGETAQQALSRELREELRIDAEVGDLITTTVHEYEFAIVELSTFRCRLLAGDPTLVEHQDYRWLSPAEMDEVTWAPADVPTVDILRTAP